MSEREVLEKLILKEHVNVWEREQLPGKQASGNLLVEIISEHLEKTGKFPEWCELEMDFDGALILNTAPNEYRVYRNAEVLFLRYRIVKEETHSDSRRAAEAYLALCFRGNIDGIPINWE